MLPLFIVGPCLDSVLSADIRARPPRGRSAPVSEERLRVRTHAAARWRGWGRRRRRRRCARRTRRNVRKGDKKNVMGFFRQLGWCGVRGTWSSRVNQEVGFKSQGIRITFAYFFIAEKYVLNLSASSI